MKFIYLFNKTPLHIAIEKMNLPIVQLLLSNPKIDVNIKSIQNIMIFILFQNNISL